MKKLLTHATPTPRRHLSLTNSPKMHNGSPFNFNLTMSAKVVPSDKLIG